MEYVPSLQTVDAEGRELAKPSWHMVNRAQNLRSYVSADGWTIQPRESDAVQWQWIYALASVGRGGEHATLETPNETDIAIDENDRVTIDRRSVVEWYENSAEGIEQGFIVPERPKGDGPLEVTATIDTTLAVQSVSDDKITFSTDTMDVLTLRGLKVWDSTGRVLTSSFIHDPKRSTLAIAVADEGAVYPVTIDPLATSPSWTAESDQADAYFGISVAAAGDVNGDGYGDVIVGAYQFDNGQSDEGRAFVYHGSASGLSASANWTAESDQVLAAFGISVAAAGDVNGDGYGDVIVGAHLYDNGQSDEGRAFVYHGSASGLSASANWTAESNQSFASFGFSASSAGDVNGDGYGDVVVGAGLYDNGEADEGRAYVYHGGASGLAGSAAWTAEADQADARFGHRVSPAGDVNGDGYGDVIIGSILYDNGQSNEGRAFVYHGSSSGLSVSAAWTAESNQADAQFSGGISTAGDVNGDGYSDIIVGAQYYDNGQSNEGRAFVFHGSSGGLSVSANWTAESDQVDALFGLSVAAAGDVNGDGYGDIIVGATDYDNGQSNEGRAFVYHGAGSGLSGTVAWTAESDQADALFGYSVAPAGDTNGDGYSDVIVGVLNYDNGQTNEGRAYVYRGSASGLASSAAWTAESDQASARTGYSVASAGDVNGDGYGDVIVAAHNYDNGQTDEGRTFVFHGSSTGLSASPAWTAESDQASAWFGNSVASAGDVNGDGYSDVIVGAQLYDNGQTDEGRAYVYLGGASGLSVSAAWTAESNEAGSNFGVSVNGAGDVNGDGYGDVIVGAHLFDNDQVGEGRIFVYHGGASGLAVSASWTAESDQAGGNIGVSVAGAGDVNGDGYSDVIAGAYTYDNGQSNEGRAFVYHGGASGLAASAAWTAESNQATANFGVRVATAGDVNGDGYSDVIIGANLYDNGQSNEGRAFVYHGGASGLAASAAWTAESDQASAFYGFSVASAGDVNGDGYSDAIVGAYLYTNGQTQEGRAYVYHGGASGLAASAAWTTESDQVGAQFGYSVATAGDVNGDGYSDAIVGAWQYANGQSNEGRAFVYYGNGGAGALSVLPRQLDASDDSVQLLGKVSGNFFQMRLKARTSYGRSRVKLQWEAKPLGTPFNGTGLGKSIAWSDSTVGGVTLTDTTAGLSSNTRYHWRVRVISDSPYTTATPWYSIGPNGWNESDISTGVVVTADLSVTKAVNDPTPSVGDPVAFTVTVSNAGAVSATSVVVKDLLPAGVTYSSNTPSQGSYVSGTGMWTVGTIANGGSANIVINASVDSGTGGTTISNWAEVWSVNETDPDSVSGNSSTTEDDDASAAITVQAADLSLTKTVDIPTPNPGDTVEYTLVVSNAGPSSATSVVVEDVLPAGMTYVSDNPSQGAYDDGTGLWAVGTVSNGGSATLTITATVDAGTAGSDILNSSQVHSADQEDPDSTPGDDSTTEDDDASASLHVPSTSATLTNTVRLSRLKQGETSQASIAFVLQNTLSGVLTVTFPAGFTVISAPTNVASSGCLSGFGHTAQTIYATKANCSGSIVLGGATVTNPNTPGVYTISWVNDDPGESLVYIIDDDQVTVTANVDPFLSFSVGAQASATACDGTFSGSGGSLDLGVLTTSSVTSSDASSVDHLCTRLSTNASGGARVTVRSLNGANGLVSASVPTDTIPSNTATLVAGTAGYGLCAGSAGGDSGNDVIDGSSSPVRSAPFNGACTSAAHDVGGLTNVLQNLWTIAGPAQNAFVRAYVKAAISGTTAAHADYADTLIFIATGAF